jgi:hypothetical protein
VERLEPLMLHEARYTCASLMIAAGVNAKALSTIMGHATIAMTFDTYGHLMPGWLDESARATNAYLWQGSPNVRRSAWWPSNVAHVHWMNSGEGAWLRHQDYMLQTGQWTVAKDPAVAAGEAAVFQEQEAEAVAVRERFLAAMVAAGSPGAGSLPMRGEGRAVAYWKVGETTERTATQSERRYQKSWHLTERNQLCYIAGERVKGGFLRKDRYRDALSPAYNPAVIGLTPAGIANTCERIAAEHGAAL